MPGDYLFAEVDIHHVQESQRARMAEAIANLSLDIVRGGDIDALAEQMADGYRIEVPELTEGAISVTVDEAEVDVTGDFRFAAWGPGPHLHPGIQVTYYVPFRGDKDMFRVQPSMYSMVHPAAELLDTELRFTVERPDEDVELVWRRRQIYSPFVRQDIKSEWKSTMWPFLSPGKIEPTSRRSRGSSEKEVRQSFTTHSKPSRYGVRTSLIISRIFTGTEPGTW